MSDGKLTDSMCWKVYKQINELDKPTPSKVSNELDSSIPSLRRYFKLLESIEAVSFTKEGRKKIYKTSNFRSGIHKKFRKYHKFKCELEEADT